jgi:hypothetical protein
MRQCFVHCTLATPINDWLLIWAERQRTCHLRPNPAKRPKASPQWELLKAEQLAHNKFIAFKVRKEVQRQLQAHSRPALEHVHPLEHLPWVNRIKALAIHLTSWLCCPSSLLRRLSRLSVVAQGLRSGGPAKRREHVH